MIRSVCPPARSSAPSSILPSFRSHARSSVCLVVRPPVRLYVCPFSRSSVLRPSMPAPARSSVCSSAHSSVRASVFRPPFLPSVRASLRWPVRPPICPSVKNRKHIWLYTKTTNESIIRARTDAAKTILLNSKLSESQTENQTSIREIGYLIIWKHGCSIRESYISLGSPWKELLRIGTGGRTFTFSFCLDVNIELANCCDHFLSVIKRFACSQGVALSPILGIP